MKTINKKNLTRQDHKEYLKAKLKQISSTIHGGNFFERLFQKLFRGIYQKRAQKTALNKFDEINKIAAQLREKRN